jgi:hypothetical protein
LCPLFRHTDEFAPGSLVVDEQIEGELVVCAEAKSMVAKEKYQRYATYTLDCMTAHGTPF